MLHKTYSLHKIHTAFDFAFDAGEYSRFKFGDGNIAADFGTSLAEGFISDVLTKTAVDQQIVVISSPYSFIPTATYAMKDHFVFRLNRWLAEHHLPVVQETKVHRTITYKEDYGALSAEQRMQLIGNDSFHIDAAFLKDKVLIFLDDIKITGSHERMISKMIGQYGLDNDIYMLYFAELANTDIHPNIENYLNYHDVNSIFDLDDIINGGDFRVNTRLVKYILNYDHEPFCLFIQSKQRWFINQLYNMALGNSYHTMEAYAPNLNYIKNHLFNNNQVLQYGN
ncbi:phosphoribosyltransferase family protein [Mucilaginibacter myungsuensis]|uniref:Phosphoribosyltransferase family protein n=1 Tax=Mucilaginibacter myungsuensis TaxID=649104 RepID=A0A929L008_9SPHI|nr:phosphoribosyltransferase family protein [Mucilaginibacter myungsuensis]MBE9663752.1 phosphoribosyltransferase family protein [Mucilaginibacter myungsuensis]MDN3598922.1 phosphoribosyltransferase family protein [Mucilaginibacter myungsuensis]